MGNRIREIRQQRAHTVAGLARVLGLSERTIRYWEDGRSLPTKANARRLARALGVTVEDLALAVTVEELGLDG